MHIMAIRLPDDWNEPLVDAASDMSVLPASLAALTLVTGSEMPWDRQS